MRERMLDCWDDISPNDILGLGSHCPDDNYIVENASKEEINVRSASRKDTQIFTYFKESQKVSGVTQHYRFSGKEKQDIIDRYLFRLTK